MVQKNPQNVKEKFVNGNTNFINQSHPTAKPTAKKGVSADLSADLGALGNTTKLRAKKDQKPTNKGFIDKKNNRKNAYSPHQFRQDLYSNQSKAKKILSSEKRLDKRKQLTYAHRVCYCHHTLIDSHKDVSIMMNEQRKRAQFSNLMVCGSVWNCPICANRISTARKQELFNALLVAFKQGLGTGFMTLTSPHSAKDRLEDILQKQNIASEKFFRQRKVREIFASLGAKGRIATKEVKYGSNGWHPHYHIVFILENFSLMTDEIENQLKLEWINACKKAGMKKLPSFEHGLDFKVIKDKEQLEIIAEYMTKHGCMPTDNHIDTEMTKWHVKHGKSNSLTPFDLLRLSSGEVDCKYAKLFKEYANAYKGKQQLIWSKGLKDLLSVEEITDEELATQTEKQSNEMYSITPLMWEIVKKYGTRDTLLTCAEYDFEHNTNSFRRYLINMVFLYIEDSSKENEDESIDYIRRYEKLYEELMQIQNMLEKPI